MSERPTPVWVYVPADEGTAIVRGYVRDVLVELGDQWPVYDRARRGWRVPSDRVGDLLALLQTRPAYLVRVRRVQVVPA